MNVPYVIRTTDDEGTAWWWAGLSPKGYVRGATGWTETFAKAHHYPAENDAEYMAVQLRNADPDSEAVVVVDTARMTCDTCRYDEAGDYPLPCRNCLRAFEPSRNWTPKEA